MTSNTGHWDKSVGTLGVDEYSSNGWKYGQGSSYLKIPCDYVPSTPFSIEFECMGIGNYDMAIFFDSVSNKYFNFQKSQNKVRLVGTNSQDTSISDFTGKYTLKIYSNKAELYKNDSKLLEVNLSSISPSISLEAGVQTGRWIQLKNFKIREL